MNNLNYDYSSSEKNINSNNNLEEIDNDNYSYTNYEYPNSNISDNNYDINNSDYGANIPSKRTNIDNRSGNDNYYQNENVNNHELNENDINDDDYYNFNLRNSSNNNDEELKEQSINNDNENDNNISNNNVINFNYMKDKESIYVMTIELEEGNSVNIHLYDDSSPDRLANEFCLNFNLQLDSYEHLKNEIEKLMTSYHQLKQDQETANNPSNRDPNYNLEHINEFKGMNNIKEVIHEDEETVNDDNVNSSLIKENKDSAIDNNILELTSNNLNSSCNNKNIIDNNNNNNNNNIECENSNNNIDKKNSKNNDLNSEKNTENINNIVTCNSKNSLSLISDNIINNEIYIDKVSNFQNKEMNKEDKSELNSNRYNYIDTKNKEEDQCLNYIKENDDSKEAIMINETNNDDKNEITNENFNKDLEKKDYITLTNLNEEMIDNQKNNDLVNNKLLNNKIIINQNLIKENVLLDSSKTKFKTELDEILKKNNLESLDKINKSIVYSKKKTNHSKLYTEHITEENNDNNNQVLKDNENIVNFNGPKNNYDNSEINDYCNSNNVNLENNHQTVKFIEDKNYNNHNNSNAIFNYKVNNCKTTVKPVTQKDSIFDKLYREALVKRNKSRVMTKCNKHVEDINEEIETNDVNNFFLNTLRNNKLKGRMITTMNNPYKRVYNFSANTINNINKKNNNDEYKTNNNKIKSKNKYNQMYLTKCVNTFDNNQYNYNKNNLNNNIEIKSNNNIGENLYLKGVYSKEIKKNEIAKIQRDIDNEEMYFCTFKPETNVSRPSSRLKYQNVKSSNYNNFDTKLYYRNKAKNEAKLRNKLYDNETILNTFSPKTNVYTGKVFKQKYNMLINNNCINYNNSSGNKSNYNIETNSNSNNKINNIFDNYLISNSSVPENNEKLKFNHDIINKEQESNTKNFHQFKEEKSKPEELYYSNSANKTYKNTKYYNSLNKSFAERQEELSKLHEDNMTKLKEKHKSPDMTYEPNLNISKKYYNNNTKSNINLFNNSIYNSKIYENSLKDNKDNIISNKNFNTMNGYKDKMFNCLKEEIFTLIFKLLDSDGDDHISSRFINIKNLSFKNKKVTEIITPLINEIYEDNESLNCNEFISAMNQLFNVRII